MEMIYDSWELDLDVKYSRYMGWDNKPEIYIEWFRIRRAFDRDEKFWEPDLRNLEKYLASDHMFIHRLLEEIADGLQPNVCNH